MLTQLFRMLPVTMLLFVLLTPIVNLNGELLLTPPRDPAPYIDTSEFISESLFKLLQIRNKEERTKKLSPSRLQFHTQEMKFQQANFNPLKSSSLSLPSLVSEKQQQHQHVQHVQQVQEFQQLGQQQLSESNAAKEHYKNINDTILEIFKLGPEEGLNLFNKVSEQHTNRQPNPDSFIFPEPPHKVVPPSVFPTRTFTTGRRLKCEDNDGKPFCTKVSNYPELSSFETILKREYSNFFGEDLSQPQNITQRMNYEPDEQFLCRSVEKIIYPEAGETVDSTWRFIVNKENFKQGVRIEECINEGSQCSFMDSLQNNYRAICKQNYIFRHLVAVSDNGTNITKDQFKMPSCCKCVVKPVRN